MPDPRYFQFDRLAAQRQQIQNMIETRYAQLDRLCHWIYCAPDDSGFTTDLAQRQFNYFMERIRAEEDTLKNLTETDDKRTPLENIFKTVRAWPEVVSAHADDLGFHIIFIPMLLTTRGKTKHPTSLVEMIVDNTGRICGGNSLIYHPHIMRNDICRGDAETAFFLAQDAQNLLAILTIAREMVRGWNIHSELNRHWRSGAVQWWTINVYQNKGVEVGAWDGHTVLDTETGEIKYVELIYQNSLRDILQLWASAVPDEDEDHDDEDNDDCYAHCDHCNNCIPFIDDGQTCAEQRCRAALCDTECLRIHYDNQHEMVPCENSELHEDEYVFTRNKCDLCPDTAAEYLCEDCLDQHKEDEHNGETSAPTSSAPLPNQSPLIIDTFQINLRPAQIGEVELIQPLP